MSDPKEWWPNSLEDEEEAAEGEPSPSAPKTCRACGQGDLGWGNIDGKWRLFGGGGLHVCPVAPLPQVIKMANGSTIRAAKRVDAVRGFTPPPTNIPL